MWTRFMDMHSGGGTKEKYGNIYIEAPEDEAIRVFFSRFGHNPTDVACDCCGDNYSISHYDTLQDATASERGCLWITKIGDKHKGMYHEKGQAIPEGYEESEWQSLYDHKYQTLEEYLKDEYVLVIYSKDIKDEERKAKVAKRVRTYVWE